MSTQRDGSGKSGWWRGRLGAGSPAFTSEAGAVGRVTDTSTPPLSSRLKAELNRVKDNWLET